MKAPSSDLRAGDTAPTSFSALPIGLSFATANGVCDLQFVLQRRKEECEAAARRVRCNFRRRGKWTSSHYAMEHDPDAARIITSSGRRFLIATRGRRTVNKRRRLFAACRITRFVAKHGTRRQIDRIAATAALAAKLELQRRCAAMHITHTALAYLGRRAVQRKVASSKIQTFVKGYHSIHIAREEAKDRVLAAKYIARSIRKCQARQQATRTSIDAGNIIRRAVVRYLVRTREIKQRPSYAAGTIGLWMRGRLARRAYLIQRSVHYRVVREHQERLAADVLLRWARLVLAKREVLSRSIRCRKLAQSQLGARAVLARVYCTRLLFCAERRRVRIRIAAEKGHAARRLTRFARGVLAKGRCRRIRHRRAAQSAARLLQRIWRGFLGRRRFMKMKAEMFTCRRCKATEYGGLYCKHCGFARYSQSLPKFDFGNSPYAPDRVRPKFVKKWRSRIAAATRKSSSETSLLPLLSSVGGSNYEQDKGEFRVANKLRDVPCARLPIRELSARRYSQSSKVRNST